MYMYIFLFGPGSRPSKLKISAEERGRDGEDETTRRRRDDATTRRHREADGPGGEPCVVVGYADFQTFARPRPGRRRAKGRPDAVRRRRAVLVGRSSCRKTLRTTPRIIIAITPPPQKKTQTRNLSMCVRVCGFCLFLR